MIGWLLLIGYALAFPALIVVVYSIMLWILDKYVDRGPFGDTWLAIFCIAFLVGYVCVYAAGAVAIYQNI
ncbi:hypothetical protein SEA_FORZA_68 [Gordonia phage Forza]|uniref:Uncharacterized protein n=1 Tax=Gordonia phage Forza TaxID=2571247 RepID=A0A650F0I6_9CAUD|nr:hypothetical protein PP303_gp068 [Gordonia phage Forza]QEM41537.1 hypothetical protein SEA_BOOPY_68 [Gordonia phage Boopy]QGT55061.1 hypothetical protein SEA_FORZA_68 [Gordonia phage Forza]UXE04210.1 hypothetical protein SEA_BLUENGOLD_66 [Gordonia phage BlueNGold]WBF03849.1 hypothetical protein SEA_MAREELIH_66 [Gordonia phage Mareelih]